MKIPHSEEKIEELKKGKVWIDEIDQRCLFESDVKKLAKEYGSYMYLQCIEAAKKSVPKEKNTTYTSNDGKEYNKCRDETLKNLESLSLDSTKE